MRGNVLDMAVGVIMGVAFGKIVTSLVNDVLMPPIGRVLGRADFSGLFINLSDRSYASLAEAKAAGAATINYGVFLNSVLDFLLVAVAVFFLVRQVHRLRQREAAQPPTASAPSASPAFPGGRAAAPTAPPRCSR